MLFAGTGKTLCDMRGLHPVTRGTYIAHEVKAPWAERHQDRHFGNILQDLQLREDVARPAAQIVYYMVRLGLYLQELHK